MREIKFRAFDPVNKLMRFADICDLGEMSEWVTWENPVDSPINKGVGFDIMQFTGLQDVNGVDIYESDIIKKPNNVWGVMVWKDYAFEVTVSETQSSLYSLAYFEDVEVIGNIHENPNLLNGDNNG